VDTNEALSEHLATLSDAKLKALGVAVAVIDEKVEGSLFL
jgi:hypothetical protein